MPDRQATYFISSWVQISVVHAKLNINFSGI